MKSNPCLFFLSLVFCLFVAQTARSAPQVTITDKARQHFRAGVAYIDDPSGPKYEEAYREFHVAYAESPSYKILTNLGLCALNLERDGEAIASYEGFLAHATAEDIPADKRKIMERDITTLKSSLVTVTLSGVPEHITLIDERLPNKGSIVTNRYELVGGALTLGLHPGHHRITAQASGYETEIWEIEADSATNHKHAFILVRAGESATLKDRNGNSASSAPDGTRRDVTAPLEKDKRVIPTLFYVTAVSTGVFGIGTGASAIMQTAKLRDFDRENETVDSSLAPALRKEYLRLRTITYIGGGLTAASAIAAAVLYFTAPRKAELSAKRQELSIVPEFGMSYVGASASTTF